MLSLSYSEYKSDTSRIHAKTVLADCFFIPTFSSSRIIRSPYGTILFMENSKRSHIIFALNILTFLLTLHTALPVYISSSYLSTFINEKTVGLVYSFCSILAILAFMGINPVLRRLGNYRTFFILLSLEILTLIGIAFAQSALSLISAFALNFVSIALLSFSMDVFVETYSTDIATGKTRGVFMTYLNTAWIIAALITSVILTNSDYWKIYGAAALIFIPILFLFLLNFRDFKDRPYRATSYRKDLASALRNGNVRSILIVTFLLQFFYAWMTIYMPLYLHNHIGFDWKTIGIIFSVMLLPFVMTELPLGKIADSRLGEKEMLSLGLLIMGVATASMSFISIPSFWLWAILLVTTRIGASIVESMKESYLFKTVTPGDVSILSISRNTVPLAYIIAPFFTSAFLAFFDFKFLFAFVGLSMIFGLRYSLVLVDTK